jgi:Trypsin-like peptidase domain
LENLVQAIVHFLREEAGAAPIPLKEVHRVCTDWSPIEVDEVVSILRDQHLVRITLMDHRLQLTTQGVIAHSDGSIAAMALGFSYIAEKYRNAVVHIVVRKGDGTETGGSGFFVKDFPGCILTAAHVVRDHDVLRIEDCEGTLLPIETLEVYFGPLDLDLSLIRLKPNQDGHVIPIEWRPEYINICPQELLIFGYPPYPHHHPALYRASAELISVPRPYTSTRDKLLLSSVTRPGFSGGPVLSNRGFAIGVIEQENESESLERKTPLVYCTATSARYCKEVLFPL